MPHHLTGNIRKSHTKSRTGCATCKRRHIRCDEHRPECKNCMKHHVRCDFVSPSPQPPPSRLSTPRGPNLLSTPIIEEELEKWRLSGVFPFPEMKLEHTNHFSSLSRVELRLIHHLGSIHRDMMLADFMQCTLWVRQIPAILDTVTDHSYALHAALAFSASHLAWVTKSTETNELAYKHRGLALNGLQEAVGKFSRENCDAILAASLLLCWQASDWTSWKFNVQGIATVISSMESWKETSRFAGFIKDHPGFFTAQTHEATFSFDTDSLPLAVNALCELSMRLQNVHPVAPQVRDAVEFAKDFQLSSASMQREELFEKLIPLRNWLFWLPVALVRNNDMSNSAMVLLAQLHALALAIDASLPELNNACFGSLTIQATQQIDRKLHSKSYTVQAPGEMHIAEIDNLMHFARLMTTRNQALDLQRVNNHLRAPSRSSYHLHQHRHSYGSGNGTPDYPPPHSPASAVSLPILGTVSLEDLSLPPSPFLHYSDAGSRRTSLLGSPQMSERSCDNHSLLSGYSFRGDSPAYSPAAQSPIFLPDMPTDDWAFGADFLALVQDPETQTTLSDPFIDRQVSLSHGQDLTESHASVRPGVSDNSGLHGNEYAQNQTSSQFLPHLSTTLPLNAAMPSSPAHHDLGFPVFEALSDDQSQAQSQTQNQIPELPLSVDEIDVFTHTLYP